MEVINSIPLPKQANLDPSPQEIQRINSSSDAKVSSIAKERISTLGRIFKVSLRLTLVVILLPALLVKSIYDMVLFVFKGKKPEQKISENPNIILESKKEETKDLIQDLPLEMAGSAAVIKESGHDNSKNPVNQGCYEEKQMELEALLNPFVDRKEIKEETAASNHPSFSLSDILGYFKPLFFSRNKMSSERDLEELRDKFSQMELNQSADLQKEKVQQKKVRFDDEVQQAPTALKSEILHSSISHALNIGVVEKQEKEVPKKLEPEQKQPVRTSTRLAEKKEKERSFTPSVQTPPKEKEVPKKSESEQKQPVRTSTRLAEKKEKEISFTPSVQTPPKEKKVPRKSEPEEKGPVRTSARVAEKQAPKATAASSEKAPAKKSKAKEPEATTSLRRSARLAAKK